MNDPMMNSDNSSDIDPLFLARLVELGGPKLAHELVGMYLVRGSELLNTIAAGIRDQDFPEIKNASHSLISSAGNLGGKKVSELAKLLEKSAIEERNEDLDDLLSQAKAAQGLFEEYLRGVLEKV